jgi:hypothetical protein
MLIVLQLDLIPLNRSFRDVAETCEMALRYSHWAGNPQSTYGAAVPSWFELFLQLPCDGAPIAHRNGGSAMLHLCSPLKPQEADIQMLSYHLGYAVCYVNAVPPPICPTAFQHLYGLYATARHPELVTPGRNRILLSRMSTAWMSWERPPSLSAAQKRSFSQLT